jgi:isopenicillin N synthase-like dioxygenase
MPDNVWPDADVPEFHADVQWLYGALDAMGLKVLEAISVYLGLPRQFFADKVETGNSILRLLHYPPVPPQEAGGDGPHIRAAAHEDINVITLLLGAEEAGLEVKDHDGRWIPINPPEGSLVCNIGDMLQRLTNHRLPSTSHRVVNPAPERRSVPRYSTPFFLHFNSDYPIETLPSCVDTAHPDRYPAPITADDYLRERLREIKLA